MDFLMQYYFLLFQTLNEQVKRLNPQTNFFKKKSDCSLISLVFYKDRCQSWMYEGNVNSPLWISRSFIYLTLFYLFSLSLPCQRTCICLIPYYFLIQFILLFLLFENFLVHLFIGDLILAHTFTWTWILFWWGSWIMEFFFHFLKKENVGTYTKLELYNSFRLPVYTPHYSNSYASHL